jgi:hypothetical protein
MWTDPRTGEQVPVNDFGNCNGLKKVKGFRATLADQVKEVKAGRKLIELSIDELKPQAKIALNAWREKHGRSCWWVSGLFEPFLTEQWEALGCPGRLVHFIRACRRIA